MGALMAGLRAVGKFRLAGDLSVDGGEPRDAVFITDRIALLDRDNREIAQLVMGGPKGDILHVDGCEVGIGQQNDPGKLRFWARYTDGTPGARFAGGGVLSFNNMRQYEDVMEEQVMVNAGSQDNPTSLAGMFRVLIRCSDEQEDWRTAFAATTYRLGRLWTGAANWLGHLWVLNNPGDPPPPPHPAGRIVRIESGTGRYMCQIQEEDGNFVGYDMSDPQRPVALFDWFGIKATLEALLQRIADLERRR